MEGLHDTLYRPGYEHDACGVGFVAETGGEPKRRVLAIALESVTNLTHRGAVDADAKTGDGAGVMTQIPYRLFRRELERLGARIDSDEDLAVGVAFLPLPEDEAARARAILEEALRGQGLHVLGWRPVPVDLEALGTVARNSRPQIEHVLVGRPAGLQPLDYARRLYVARKDAERRALEEGLARFYVASLSNRTLVYKGMMVAPQLDKFYLDLRDEAYETALAVFHQRYSTNTFPNWYLAQPFRFLAHNGEINTLQGNRNWMRAREAELRSPVWGDDVERLKPVVWADGSDSASLDNVLELLVLSGRDLLHSMMMLVPEAWENMPNMPEDVRAFYEYHACLSEPWDGPAALAFTDGVLAGACLDRNGLRPARYKVMDDGLVVMGSEVGMADLDDRHVVEKGRLGPGQMIAVDTRARRFLHNDAIKREVANRAPYGDWVRRRLFYLDEHLGGRDQAERRPDRLDTLRQHVAFGYTSEELQFIIKPMTAEGKEPVGSMGDDTPLSVLATRPRLLYTYFKQKFAQVTNPPIDPIREELVMSLDVYLGRRGSLLEESEEHARLVHLVSPLLINEELAALRALNDPAFAVETLDCRFPAAEGPAGLRKALERLCCRAEEAVDAGKTILILSDRGVDAEYAPVPMALAVGAVHHHLIRAGKRMRASIIAETAEARDVHHIAVLIGYGASAVNPYLAYATVQELVESGEIKEMSLEQALANYEKAVDAGILKIMSKMGISTVSAYQGAQIFEAIGLNREVVDLAFAGTVSRIGGIGLEEIAQDVLHRHATAFLNGQPKLEDGSFYRFRREGEYHAFNPEVIKALQQAARNGNREDYESYARLVQGRPPTALRDLLDFRRVREPIPLEEVEPAEEIARRFATSAMSLGALSPEAHTTVTIAMNRIGAKSNTGEGGEDATHYRTDLDGDSPNSKIKQVASGRFGVTPEYLALAEELEIKMAQGSKPGEGGQLPGHKVSAYIASLRHTLPGTPLISPPPHHDIYSIEDLAQLIYDLKTVNPRARVAVKLVSEEGVGTIAAGVAKGYADTIQISGHDGGTGASPWSSIKYAGSPWELGLAETQQTLVMNDLRGRVRIRADGGMKTGRDVVIAAMLGADEFGFGTASLVAVGCKMARQCHLNTCPVGVATQREDLRAKFPGKPEHLVNFMIHVAEEVREILAELGFRSLEEVIGRSDLLQQVISAEDPRSQKLDLSPVLAPADPTGTRPIRCVQARNDRHDDERLDDLILRDAKRALDGETRVLLSYPIRNTHRTVGARVAGEIAYRYGNQGLPEGAIEVHFRGSAGQSFGAFCVRGLRLVLTGEANDYVAKGMGGGEVVVRPPADAPFASHENVIVGNTVLYGATGGTLFVAGRAGERFAVRNSGARAVVEGVGDHGCEYMTEGVVVILGETGRNFGAGMSNGVAYVLDEKRTFPSKLNPELVGLHQVTADEDTEILLELLRRHYQATGSRRAYHILTNWPRYQPLFWKVVPHAAMITEDGPMAVVRRHLESLRASAR